MTARFLVLTVTMAALVAGVGACGKKGPLYLPKTEAPATQPAPAANDTPVATPADSPPVKSPP